MKISKQRQAQMRKLIEIGGKISQTAVHLTSGTTVLGKAGAVLGLVDAVIGASDSLISEFDDHEHLDLSRPVCGAAFSVLMAHGKLAAGRVRGKELEWVFREGEVTLLWVKDGQEISGPWFQGCAADEARTCIGRALWEALGPNITAKITGWGRELELLPDVLTQSSPSAVANEVASRCKKLTKAGVHRGILFHGPPGTGKSFVMREIAKSLGGFSIRHECMSYTDDVIPDLTDLLKPRSLLMDDIDRGSTSGILSAMERFRQHCDVVLVSANYLGKLDPAIRRPGRFDESIYVDKLDPTALSELLGDAPAIDVQVLRELPAAYVREYTVIREHYGNAVAAKRLVELTAQHKVIMEAASPATKGEVQAASKASE